MQRLSKYPFRDRRRAEKEIQALKATLPESTGSHLELLLLSSPAPELALNHFASLSERQPAAFKNLTASAAGLRYLATVFSYSRFLSEQILEHPGWARKLLSGDDMERALPAEEFRERLEAELPNGIPPPLLLAQFRRRQILRIMLRDVLGLGELAGVTAELTALADAIVEATYERIHRDLVGHYGTPRDAHGEEAHFAVIALGKMGGEELNYSSDIDLMFLYSANGETRGARSLANKEFFQRAANQLTALLSAYTAEGLCYRLDLRLRPDGSLGEVCLSVDGAKQYYRQRARDWELQMMIKARVAAGHRPTGRALLDFVETLSYSTTLDFSAVEQLSATRERLNEKLSARQNRKATPHETVDVKLDRGGIRDIEFLVQCLQRMHGGEQQWVRHRGTLLALARLQEKNLLSGAEYGKLASAYQFLRHLEHRLQFDEDRQTHALPDNPRALELLASRMPNGGGSVEWLVRSLNSHFQQVLEIYERVVHTNVTAGEAAASSHAGQVVPALDQTAPQLARAMAADLHRGYRAFEHFLERLWSDSPRLARLNGDPELARATLDLFEHSPYLSEELIRTPDLLDEIANAGHRLEELAPPPADAAELRRWYRREMLRIQAQSICNSHPIFETLDRTSHLAEGVIARAYEIARESVRASHPPQDSSYEPKDQMFTIALGRLGMREFDLGSDADLTFVLADSEAGEMEFWTRVANRMCDLITAYTGSGVLFAVDTRLRPNGNAGQLVQLERTVLDYFEAEAEAWEGITYMKSRTIAGDARRAGVFLGALQAVDWQRYGQSGRSRTDLRQMRARLEKEQGPPQPLKAGRGGYYDIDFLLMYLRLKSAGVFFKVLNTPERIDVLENMAYLGREEARFLREAVTFYRALDHGLRVISGHAEGRLPQTEAQQELLGEVLERWTPVRLGDLEAIQARTRALFDRYFS